MGFHTGLNNERFTETIRRLMEENYELGELQRVNDIFGGYCNTSYAVWMSGDDCTLRYFLRLYNPRVIENEILFEHALVNHLRSNGFTLAAAIVPCRNGATVVRTPPPEHHSGKTALWALFEYLEGEDRYSWTCTDLSEEEFSSAAEVLASLHNCGHGFKKPPGADRVQPQIMNFIPTLKKTFAGLLKEAGDRRCDRLFEYNFKPICKALDDASAFGIKFQGMPKIPIHCDYHPGNLKYRNGKCIGIFDFDWSKIDYRLFDLTLGIVYFTSIWHDRSAGLQPDKFELFLRCYNDACRRFTHTVPLTEQEQKYFVPMMAIANLYVLSWDLVDLYTALEPDEEEYFKFLDHNISLMHWIEFHKNELNRWVKASL